MPVEGRAKRLVIPFPPEDWDALRELLPGTDWNIPQRGTAHRWLELALQLQDIAQAYIHLVCLRIKLHSLLILRRGSREVAEAMAGGVRRRFGTSLAVAVTGIAGPDVDASSKPLGLTYIGVASAAGTSSREFRFTGDRAANRQDAAIEALNMLIAEAAGAGRPNQVKSA